jgi:hypothetical protein
MIITSIILCHKAGQFWSQNHTGQWSEVHNQAFIFLLDSTSIVLQVYTW